MINFALQVHIHVGLLYTIFLHFEVRHVVYNYEVQKILNSAKYTCTYILNFAYILCKKIYINSYYV